MKTVTGDQNHAADSGRGGRAAGFADALDRKPCLFGRPRHGFELLHAGQIGVDQVELGKLAGQLFFVGEAGELVLRRHARHRDGAFSQHRGAVGRDLIG
jgi:hypothetical protein